MVEEAEPFMIEAIKVIAEETRKSFVVGFDKAVEMFRVVTQPAAPAGLHVPLNLDQMNEVEEMPANFIDVNTLYQMPPEQREAVLSRYGLQLIPPEETPADPVHEEMEKITKQKPTQEGDE